ncbi:MAG: HlyD family efflux transporter periplasmic adaptor subunit [Pseudomonadota bacterium]
MQPQMVPPGGGGVDEEAVPVPTLRQDLELMRGRATLNGEPTWTIYDPLRAQYFKLGRANFVFLSLWSLSKLGAIREAAQQRLKRAVTVEEIGDFAKFLLQNQLTDVSSKEGYKDYFQRAEARRKSAFSHALHGYLFFKIPLFRPDPLLRALWPFVGGLFHRHAVLAIALLGVLGLYLVSRQWSAFKDTFAALLSWEGAVYYGLSLIFVKICHELGHAFMAHKYGLRVSIIGVAFLVLMPILYTDTSNAWRLASRRKRLMIDGAGIMVELGLACLATLLWVFLPDGTVRSAVFSVAAVSWTLSLLVNLNPFMRFDGYYILSDTLEVENLQARGFALARWRLREILFGLGLPAPEVMKPALRRTLIWHAWGTWVYRFFLFVGIALLVYAFFIKVVAIVLFAVEIIWFILLPVYREMKEWWNMRELIVQKRRSMVTFAVFGLLALLLCLPLSRTVSVVGVMHAADEINVYAPYPAKLLTLNADNAQPVQQGDILAIFQSDELELKIDLVRKHMVVLQKRIDRSGSLEADRANRLVLASELAGRQGELRELLLQKEQLVLRSPIDGTVADLPAAIHAGRFVDQSTPLFRLRSPERVKVAGMVHELHLERIGENSVATFYPDDPGLPAMDMRLDKISRVSARQFSFPSMADQFGGSVTTNVEASPRDGLDVQGSYYGLDFAPVGGMDIQTDQTLRGVLHVAAAPKSLASRAYQQVASVLIRETGF